MEKYLDKTVNPGEDFFQYATGHWIDYNKQPAEYPRWGTFSALSEETIKRLNKIILRPGDSQISQKINQYYNIVMNWEKRDAEGVKPLLDYLQTNLYVINTKEEFIDFLCKEHFGLFWDLRNYADFKNSNMNALYINQSGLSLGNKDYYLDKDKKKYVNAFKKYVISKYVYLGYSKEDAREKFKTIWHIEKKLAKVSYSIEELQNPEINYYKKNIAKYSKSVKFDFVNFLTKFGYDKSTEFIVGQEKAIKHAAKLMNELPLDDLKTVAEWQIMDSASLDSNWRKIDFKFSRVFSGAKKQMPKKKAAIRSTCNIFGEAIGQVYVSKYFSEEAKEDVKRLVDSLIISYKNIICEQTWMSEETQKLALEKLNKLTVKIGYPDKVEDYSDCPVNPELSLFENKLNINNYFFEKIKARDYNMPVDKERWHMNPQDVNAYYSPTSNEICFPAGILQEPFYKYGRSAAENYGGIGVVIGHEMTHGYDNHGRQFDTDGNMQMWWKEDEIEKFNSLTENTIKRFNNFEVLPDMKANGTLTLGENLADYGGVKIAYRACANLTDSKRGWTKEFFISYATIWAGVSTEESIRTQTLNNEHSVNYARVNGTLPMFNEWYSAFGITKEDPLYVEPADRAKIW